MTPHVQTHSGRMVPLNAPTVDHIHLPDIARALARLPRFNGHTLRPWSVADHSLLVLELVGTDAPAETRLAALLHDAHEAYLGDITTPVAAAIRGTRDACPIDGLKVLFDTAIAAALHFDPAAFHTPAIRTADREALALEARHLMATPTQPWPNLPPVPCGITPSWRSTPAAAESYYLRAAADLLLERAGIPCSHVEIDLADAGDA